MKLQDLLFIVTILTLIHIRKPRLLVGAGLLCLLLSIPLFAEWIFFTAQRLTYYAGGFLLTSIILELFPKKK